MPTIQFDRRKIHQLTAEGFYYELDNGRRQFLDFGICQQHWNSVMGEGDADYRYVGFRDLMTMRPFITFVTSSDGPTLYEWLAASTTFVGSGEEGVESLAQ